MQNQTVRHIKPLGPRVLVRIRKLDDRTGAGLYLPAGAKEEHDDALYGEVVEVARAEAREVGLTEDEKEELSLGANVSGVPLGALAMICVDNPMVAATGHRICNDCMKSCIYQKTDPVDIPQSETRLLKDVLALPWGFELYSLLTRWNPLNLARPVPRAPSTARRSRFPAGCSVRPTPLRS